MDVSAGVDVTCVIAVGVAVVASVYVCLMRPTHKRWNHTGNVKEVLQTGDNIIRLFIYPRWHLGPSISLPCVAVETFLRLANVPYKVQATYDVFPSPTRTLPYIIHEGKCVAGCTVIIQYLMDTFKLKMDDGLESMQHAVGTALRNMLLYEARFALHHTLAHQAVLYTAPCALRCWKFSAASIACFLLWFRRHVLGTSKLAQLNVLRERYDSSYLMDLEAVETLIGDKPFLFGDRPTSYDCVVYAALLPIVRMKEAKFVSEPFAFAARSLLLREYVNRMTNVAFRDLEHLCCGEEKLSTRGSCVS
ncbi:Outer mitochondrial membrane transport complex protein/Glutathione S-transferase, C-terminal domain containing protein, putative [Trypanosoma equiperdum]|uniref:Thioredoxin-like fold domain-containing protein n=2 Tax=Trypanozoon TaxID=39700 RepID=Q57TV4_TRYB2|nr:hypothetical protein, conserved [Trypanosoma brucei brucei TREU927]AAX80020.1 hypothetical protein, conserved [Trypanosoma brucei]AAZ13423.1 hypothetical protein, conserved [Trypanosoma brucei brucei TREU927]SCU70244.1 Outer mitochondrial membrane transport complex protein/Glutathione S-transferase, C-terminal domain containing protein, putative [Trypanosoma equiperdum]